MLDVTGLPAGQWQLEIAHTIRSAAQTPLEHAYISTFTTVLDMTNQIRLDFSNTRGSRATGEVSYDVSLTNIGLDDLRGPLVLLLDPGRYFAAGVPGATQGLDGQSDLWLIDLTPALQASNGKFAVGQTLLNQTITVRPASSFGTTPGSGTLVKFNLSHGVYAAPLANSPPTLSLLDTEGESLDESLDDSVADIDSDALELPQATVGQAWTATIVANDVDGTQFFWQIVQAPAGLSLTPGNSQSSDDTGYHNQASLSWTPTARDPADSEVIIRVQDSRGGVATRRLRIPVLGGNQISQVGSLQDIELQEGQSLSLPLAAADADGDSVTLTVRNLPAGASFDAASGLLSWTPGYDQAGQYNNITVLASDGKSSVSQTFNITVAQGHAQPVLLPVAAQTLREGEAFGLQLAGSMPGGLLQADGTLITLEYSSPWLPGGASLNSETGFITWTPGYAQHGDFTIPVTLTATYTPADASSEPVTTSTTQNLVLNVLNANGAPQFDASETWNILEGQPLRISVFAFDPDNPGFEPKIRLNPNGAASGPETTEATVSYQVLGLPEGASFDAETMEIVWTPGYDAAQGGDPQALQAGSYSVRVIATDTGDGTGTPAISELTLPMVVTNANRAPQIGNISNATLYKGATLDIPVTAADIDGNPVTLTITGLPPFATYTQSTLTGAAHVSGVIHFAPGEGMRGDYAITIAANDNGDGNVNQTLAQATSFVLSVRSDSEPPLISAPTQVVALVGQPMLIPVSVRDLDQDALSYTLTSGPANASISADQPAVYGHASIRWTPTAEDIGESSITFTVTDSGLGPVGAGYILDPTAVIVPSSRTHTIRVMVRNPQDNAAPTLLDVTATGGTALEQTEGNITSTQVTATEGVPLSLDIFAKDSNLDLLNWSVSGLPQGMVLDVNASSNAGNASNASNATQQATLRWTPGFFAAQTQPYNITVTASDGAASFSRRISLVVSNVNQTPRILPVPLQLVSEGDLLSFNVRAVDADNDAIQFALNHDDNTPEGLLFDASTGYLEWTPSQSVVNNADGLDQAFTLTFTVTDGKASSQQTVQVRVFDVNRAPQLAVSNHAGVVGQTITLPVTLGTPATASNTAGINAWD
ncbi:MAG: putative Ig domain-containing protein, partial [Pseudomonadota bacterium]